MKRVLIVATALLVGIPQFASADRNIQEFQKEQRKHQEDGYTYIKPYEETEPQRESIKKDEEDERQSLHEIQEYMKLRETLKGW